MRCAHKRLWRIHVYMFMQVYVYIHIYIRIRSLEDVTVAAIYVYNIICTWANLFSCDRWCPPSPRSLQSRPDKTAFFRVPTSATTCKSLTRNSYLREETYSAVLCLSVRARVCVCGHGINWNALSPPTLYPRPPSENLFIAMAGIPKHHCSNYIDSKAIYFDVPQAHRVSVDPGLRGCGGAMPFDHYI